MRKDKRGVRMRLAARGNVGAQDVGWLERSE